jgi:hypothetical protein
MYLNQDPEQVCGCKPIPVDISRGYLLELWETSDDTINIELDAHQRLTLRQYAIEGEFKFNINIGDLHNG